jgi:glycosyltransferase involved in cell wall biosynthesis
MCSRGFAAAMPDPRRAVLLLAHAFPPENSPGAARPYRFAKYLPHYGYDVEVISAGPHGQPKHPVSLHRLGDTPSFWHKVIRRTVLPGEDGLAWIPPAIRTAERLIRERRISLVVSTYPPAAAHVVALSLRRRLPVRWVADFRDPLANNPVVRKTRFAEFAERRLQTSIFRRADALIAVTDVIAEQWRRDCPDAASKISVIWNGFDPEDPLTVGPPPPRSFRVLAHIGSLYGGRVPTLLLASLRRLISSGRLPKDRLRVRLLGVLEKGVVARDQQLWDELERLGVLSYNGVQVPRAEAARETAEADSLLLVDLNIGGAGHAVPAKLFEYVMAGRPVLALTTRQSPVERILSQSGIPSVFLYPGDSESAIDEKVLQFVSLPAALSTPSDWFINEFDGRRQTETLARILDGLIARKG